MRILHIWFMVCRFWLFFSLENLFHYGKSHQWIVVTHTHQNFSLAFQSIWDFFPNQFLFAEMVVQNEDWLWVFENVFKNVFLLYSNNLTTICVENSVSNFTENSNDFLYFHAECKLFDHVMEWCESFYSHSSFTSLSPEHA